MFRYSAHLHKLWTSRSVDRRLFPAAADFRWKSLTYQHQCPYQEEDFCPQRHSDEQHHRRWGPRFRQLALGVHDVQGWLVLAQWVGSAAGVLLTWCHICQVADDVKVGLGSLDHRLHQENLQWFNCAEPLDIRQRWALDATHSCEAGLLGALHGQCQDLRGCCNNKPKNKNSHVSPSSGRFIHHCCF